MKSLAFASAVLAMALVAVDAGATHTSKPIMATEKPAYRAGETVNIKGWVEYEGKPAADVLLEIRITSPAGSEILRKSVRGDAAGNFMLEYRMPADAAPGGYVVEVLSQCNDAHRHICTHQKSSRRITVNSLGAK